MVIERYRSRQSTGAAMPLAFSSQMGLHQPLCFRAARPGRGFSPAGGRRRDAGNNTSVRRSGWPGTPSPGANPPNP